jgi:hypothetical protein
MASFFLSMHFKVRFPVLSSRIAELVDHKIDTLVKDLQQKNCFATTNHFDTVNFKPHCSLLLLL